MKKLLILPLISLWTCFAAPALTGPGTDGVLFNKTNRNILPNGLNVVLNTNYSTNLNGGIFIGDNRPINSDLITRFKSMVDVKADFGADNTGVVDAYGAFTNALNYCSTNGSILFVPAGDYKISATLNMPRKAFIRGQGYTADYDPTYKAKTRLIKAGNFDLITITNPEVRLENIQIDGGQFVGDGIYAAGGQFDFYRVSVTSNAGNGIRIGGKIAGLNANSSRIINCEILGNLNNGIYVHDNNGGAPNANAINIAFCDIRSNGDNGILFENCIDNNVWGGLIESNGGNGVVWNPGAKGNKIHDVYTEGNLSGKDGWFKTNSFANEFNGGRQGTTLVIQDDSNGLKNYIRSRMSARVENPVTMSPEYFQDLRVIAAPYLGMLQFFQSGNDTYIVNSKPGNSSSRLKFRTDTNGVMVLDAYDLELSRQLLLNGTASTLDGYIRLQDGGQNRMEIARYNSDNTWIAFDSHYNGSSGYVADYAASSFMIRKSGDALGLYYSGFNTVSNLLTFTNGLSLDRNGKTTVSGPFNMSSQLANTMVFLDSTKILRSITSSSVPDNPTNVVFTSMDLTTLRIGGVNITNLYGENNVGQNQGAGTGVYAGKSGTNLLFNTLAGTNSISVSSNASVITIGFVRTNTTTIPISDTINNITTGVDKQYWDLPYNVTFKDVKLSLGTAASSGATTVDVKLAGSSIFSTKPSISSGNTQTTTAAVLSTTTGNVLQRLTFNIDAAGTGAINLQVTLYTQDR